MFSVLALAGAMAFATQSFAAERVVTLGTAAPGSLTNSAGSAIAKVMKEKRGTEVRVQPFAGSGPLVALVQQKKLDLCIVNVFELDQAMKGQPPFQSASPDLRALSSIFQSYVGFLVAKDSPIKTLADLKGKNIPSGYSAAPIIEPMRKSILANAGITDDQVNLVPVPNSVRSGDLLQQGRVDVAFLSIGSGKVAELDAAMGGVRFLSLSGDPKDVAAMQKVMPQALASPLTAAPSRPGIEDGTRVLGYDFLLVAHKDADQDLVRAAVDVLMRERQALAAALPHFGTLTLERQASVPAVPYHPAAIEIYKQLGAMK
jgi:TRAP transporter TAXI family solute receptor